MTINFLLLVFYITSHYVRFIVLEINWRLWPIWYSFYCLLVNSISFIVWIQEIQIHKKNNNSVCIGDKRYYWSSSSTAICNLFTRRFGEVYNFCSMAYDWSSVLYYWISPTILLTMLIFRISCIWNPKTSFYLIFQGNEHYFDMFGC